MKRIPLTKGKFALVDIEIYLIHFDRPYKHAGHYLGSTRLTAEQRMKRHRGRRGAKLLKVLQKEGIGYKIVRTWGMSTEEETRALEKKMKACKNNRLLCPICCPIKFTSRFMMENKKLATTMIATGQEVHIEGLNL